MPSHRGRVGAVAVSLLLVLSPLAGCGRSSPAQPSAQAPRPASTTPAGPTPPPAAPPVSAGTAPAGVSSGPGGTTTPATTARPVAPATTTPATTSRPVAPATTAAPAAAPAPAARPAFVGTVSQPGPSDLQSTYRAGCPVGPAQLRVLHMSYWGFDHQVHVGTMVVNQAVTASVLTVFSRLFAVQFPIRQMQPEDAFGGDDPASMAADNTSGFNCRTAVAPGPPQWSVHAFGEAIDVNPVENPYLEGGAVQPAGGTPYLNRSLVRPGMAVAGGPLVEAFASVGWSWGGRWTAAPDYQHFSLTGG